MRGREAAPTSLCLNSSCCGRLVTEVASFSPFGLLPRCEDRPSPVLAKAQEEHFMAPSSLGGVGRVPRQKVASWSEPSPSHRSGPMAGVSCHLLPSAKEPEKKPSLWDAQARRESQSRGSLEVVCQGA